eukprot:TRINITY_DN21790_c0_g2_i1.p1 TRINITY_DN21790_c0_g2~~TRINITY_DN21790_c0_g2_i1.p1  ORF type:complete len:387 (+),score=71.46 TRINITY_DN21790_c0_g2_i1:109-1161(+)
MAAHGAAPPAGAGSPPPTDTASTAGSLLSGAGSDVLPVALRLKSLASVTGNQPYIARKGVLPTLLKFLRSEQIAVQLSAAETLRLLSSHPDNPSVMAQDAELVRELRDKLLQLQREPADNSTQQLRGDLEATCTALRGALPPDQQWQLDIPQPGGDGMPGLQTHSELGQLPPGAVHPAWPPAADAVSGVSYAQSAYPSVMPTYRREHTARRPAGTGRQARARRNLVVLCAGLTGERVDDCEHILRHVRGVVSYSIVGQELHLFCSTPTQMLLHYLAECGFEPHLLHENCPPPTHRGGSVAGSIQVDYARALVGQGKVRDHTDRHPRRDRHANDRSTVASFFQNLGRTLFS